MSLRKKLLIVGAGGHGKSVAEATQLTSDFVIAGFLDDCWPNCKSVFSYPVLGNIKNLISYRDITQWAIVAIGNNEIRKKIILELISSNFSIATIIHPNAVVSPSAKIGIGSTIMAGAIIGTNSIIGQSVIVNCGAVVDHDCCLGDFSHLGVNVAMAGGSTTGESVWLQAGSALGYKVSLAPGTTVLPCTGVIQSGGT